MRILGNRVRKPVLEESCSLYRDNTVPTIRRQKAGAIATRVNQQMGSAKARNEETPYQPDPEEKYESPCAKTEHCQTESKSAWIPMPEEGPREPGKNWPGELEGHLGQSQRKPSIAGEVRKESPEVIVDPKRALETSGKTRKEDGKD